MCTWECRVAGDSRMSSHAYELSAEGCLYTMLLTVAITMLDNYFYNSELSCQFERDILLSDTETDHNSKLQLFCESYDGLFTIY
jgi:hypothetical protein